MKDQPQLGKYEPLFQHLVALDAPTWRVTFVDIEHILGFRLPKSARTHRPWWANQVDNKRSQARAWQAAGWRTRRVDLKAETLVFERVERCAPTFAGYGPPKRGRRTCYVAEPDPRSAETTPIPDAAQAMTLRGEVFGHFVRITPEAGPDGKPKEYMPQRRYGAAKSTPLNRHGAGPFCRFVVLGLPAARGVYAITVARKLAYVGIAADLQQRWGPSGYAQIQPRNCFKGGQSTNCKVNHAILAAAQDGLAVDLWIHRTDDPRPLEARLISALVPPWNDQR